jgi:hypothetical protein
MSFTEEEMKAEMSKPIMVAMHGLNWFLLLSLFESILPKDGIFSTEQDREACREIFKTLHNQVFNKEDKSLMDLLSLPPKKIIKPSNTIII